MAKNTVPNDNAGKPVAEPKQDPTQSVHDSVRARWDADPTYRPKPLLAYFQRTNDPRGT